MTVYAANQVTSYLWDSFAFTPIRAIADKVNKIAEVVFGYLLRIITFQLGEIKNSGAYYIMRLYQRLISCDPKEEQPFDAARLEQSKQFLTRFGGLEKSTRSQDGEEIHYMSFKSEDFYRAFAQMGSTPIAITHEGKKRMALLDPPETEAKKFYFPIIEIQMDDGSIHKGALLPEACPSKTAPHILHSHSPGRSMCMDRKLIGQHLAAGYDITVWDPRGTAESTGTPTEGGYYLDAEAVFEEIARQVPINRIYVTGFCEGAAIAAHLKKTYHERGVHFVASNPYTSMTEVVQSYGPIGRMGAHFGMKALQHPNCNIVQDGFDNIAKLQNLPHSDGKCILIHTDTDTMMPRGSVSKMITAFDHAGPVHEILRVHPNPKENGHLQPPTHDLAVWNRYINLVV